MCRGIDGTASSRQRPPRLQQPVEGRFMFWPPRLPSPCRAAERAGRVVGEEVAMKYKVLLHRSDEGISVSVPALPGCWSEGDTEEEALTNIRDAIEDYLAALEDRLQGAEVRELEV